LVILDKFGLQVANFSNAVFLDGPWDMTVNDQGSHVQLFIANALSGTITRIDLQLRGSDTVSVQNVVQIASGYTHRPDPDALVLGPTGLAYNAHTDTLYVASTADDAIFAVAHAGHATTDGGKGTSIFSDATHLHGPLGLVLAPNGDLIAANGDAINADNAQPSELVEFTPVGQFVGQFSIDTATADPFGIAITTTKSGQTRLAAVNDNHNTVTIWTL
jgi:DNA-binding beta-propeller fold protein YncE